MWWPSPHSLSRATLSPRGQKTGGHLSCYAGLWPRSSVLQDGVTGLRPRCRFSASGAGRPFSLAALGPVSRRPVGCTRPAPSRHPASPAPSHVPQAPPLPVAPGHCQPDAPRSLDTDGGVRGRQPAGASQEGGASTPPLCYIQRGPQCPASPDDPGCGVAERGQVLGRAGPGSPAP